MHAHSRQWINQVNHTLEAYKLTSTSTLSHTTSSLTNYQ